MNRMTPEEFLKTGLLEQYLMGLLSEKEAKEVALYISQHPSIQKTYNELESTIYNLAESHQIKPPDSIKGNVMDQIMAIDKSADASVSTPWSKYLMYTAALLLGLISILSYYKVQKLSNQLQKRNIEYANLEDSCKESKKQYDQQSRLFAFYKETNTQSIILNGNEKAPRLKLVSHYNKEQSQLILDLQNHDDIAKDKMLCLWGDKDGEMILITKLNESTNGTLLSFDNQMNSFNITLEDIQENIDHPDVSQLVASVAI